MATRITFKDAQNLVTSLNAMLEKRQLATRFNIEGVNGYYNLTYRRLGDNLKTYGRTYSSGLTVREARTVLITLCDGLMLAGGAEI